jgi:cyclopropane fatty-acyl-phospholipid synthase-like methyltransferase
MCGWFFLEAAQSRGYHVSGIEFASSAINGAHHSVRKKIVQGDVQQVLRHWTKKLDWVSAFDIIEHMHAPLNFIKQVKNILTPGGTLVMTTPNTDHWLRYIMRACWSMLQPFQHTVLFSKKAMRSMLEDAGFCDVKIRPAYKYLTLEYLVKQLSETNKVISKLMGFLLSIMPKFMVSKPMRINIGEFIVFAKKPTLY